MQVRRLHRLFLLSRIQVCLHLFPHHHSYGLTPPGQSRPSSQTATSIQMSSIMPPSALLSLPAELRNIIYDFVAAGTEQITIRNGNVQPHPFSQVCRQIRSEFRTLFAAIAQRSPPYLAPKTIQIQLENFDFSRTVQAIERCLYNSDTRFEVEVRVTKQLHRAEWEKMWSWIDFCDELSYRKDAPAAELHTSYEIHKNTGVCNSHAASHEMYIEVVPYILNGNAREGCPSTGYDEIVKMRAALNNAVGL